MRTLNCIIGALYEYAALLETKVLSFATLVNMILKWFFCTYLCVHGGRQNSISDVFISFFPPLYFMTQGLSLTWVLKVGLASRNYLLLSVVDTPSFYTEATALNSGLYASRLHLLRNLPHSPGLLFCLKWGFTLYCNSLDSLGNPPVSGSWELGLQVLDSPTSMEIQHGNSAWK